MLINHTLNQSRFPYRVRVEGVHLFLCQKNGKVHLVAHGAGQGVRDALDHAQLVKVFPAELFVGNGEGLAVAASGEGAEIMFAEGLGGTVEGDHVRPDFVHVRGIGEVHHVRGIAAAGAHVHFQRHHLAFFADVLVAGQAEELEVDKAAAHAEAFHRRAARGAHVRREVPDDIVQGIVVVVDDVHDGVGRDVAGLEQRLAMAVDDRVIARDHRGDELLHDVRDIGMLFAQEPAQFILVAELVRVRSADAVVRLHDDRPADLADECHAAFEVVHDVPARRGDAGVPVILLHAALVADAVQVAFLPAAGDMEVRTQHRVVCDPVFVVALQPVDAAVLADKEGHGAVNLVVILQGADLVVFVQAALQPRREFVIGAVPDPQHAQAVVFQLAAEHPVVGGKIGGDEDEVFHGNTSP